MPRKRSIPLTDGELRLMRVLWDKGRGTVGEVVDGIPGPGKPAYNTVLTLLRILERKGYVRHEKLGRAFSYVPLIDRGAARRRAIAHVLNRFFDDSPGLLVLNLLRDERLGPDELRQLRELIDDTDSSVGGERS